MKNSPAAVHCVACAYEWRSAAMAEGLRLIGSCPRCDGELVFAEPPPAHAPADTPEQVAASTDSLAPHMVLGVPRGW